MGKFLKKFRLGFASLLVFATVVSCPSTNQSLLDEARFALDACNPTDVATQDSCTTARTNAELVLQTEPNNAEAAIIASSAYLGLAGVDFLQFLEEITKNQTNDISSLQSVIKKIETPGTGRKNCTGTACAISTTNLTNAVNTLRNAVSAKSGQAGLSDLDKRALFQLGLTETIQTFVVPIKLVPEVTAGGVVNPSNITDQVAADLKTSFVDSDNNLTSGGSGSDETTTKGARQGYCRCNLQTDFGGYSAACVRDLMRCQLSDTKPTGTEQDYNLDGTCGSAQITSEGFTAKTKNGAACGTTGGGTADCDRLINPTGVATCKESDVK